tara:strand:+ start:7547 stop:7852 length:306 start_codon:yes stop_codon:yes gene_type:complete
MNIFNEKINKIIKKHCSFHTASCFSNKSYVEKTCYVRVPKKHLVFFAREFENPIEVIIQKQVLKYNIYDNCIFNCFKGELALQKWETINKKYEVFVNLMKA